MSKPIEVAVIGAGMGGLAVAAMLSRIGCKVDIYEQAHQLARIGAGIQQSPNATVVLRELGLESWLRKKAFYPHFGVSKDWDTGAITNVLPMGEAIESRYGAPFLLMHRGDLHEGILSAVPEGILHLNKKLVGIEPNGGRPKADFADGTVIEADLIIGADGVHSKTQEILFGKTDPVFSGRVAYRTTFPASLMGELQIADRTKWWGPDKHIVIYYTTREKSEVYFVTSLVEEGFSIESWSTQGDVNMLRDHYAGFHPEVQAVLKACPSVHKWALVDRQPLASWSTGSVALLGDACHPMTPYMAQGAATAIEDAAVLSRCIQQVDRDGISEALKLYEAVRKPRTSAIQKTAAENTWMKNKTDADWVYGHNAWTEPLVAAADPLVSSA
ncbi:FAD-dependent monooxygenase [Novosphingobium resinovorum]|nr:FAD-dependent monooxygenase [Novosphingobium resinovorum]